MKKKIINIVFLVILYFVISIILIIIDNNKKIVYIGNYTKVYVSKNGIKVKNQNEEINNKKINLFFENEFKKAYLSSGDADFYLAYFAYDTKGNKYNTYEDIIATTRNIDINIESPESLKCSDSEIELLSKKLNLEKNNIELNTLKKYNIDLDNDNNREVIYSISYKISDYNYKNYFVIRKNDFFNTFTSYKVDRSIPTIKSKSLFKFIDFDKDGVYEVVLSTDNGDDGPSRYEIYSYKNSELKNIK